MDILSLVGVALALVAVLVGAVLKGAGLSALLSSAAMSADAECWLSGAGSPPVWGAGSLAEDWVSTPW